MTANRRNINELRYLTRNNLVVPNNLDNRKNRTDFKHYYIGSSSFLEVLEVVHLLFLYLAVLQVYK